MSDQSKMILSIILFATGQCLVWFQVNSQFVWDWWAEKPWRGAIVYSIPAGLCFLYGVKLTYEVMNEVWGPRFLIFGMSYLYDGGGSEMQESSITTAVSDINSLIFSSDFGSNWKTAPSDWSSNAALDTSNTNSYDKSSTTNNSVISTANGQFLFYDSSSLAITHNTTYEVNFPLYFFSCGSVSVKIYVGLGK